MGSHPGTGGMDSNSISRSSRRRRSCSHDAARKRAVDRRRSERGNDDESEKPRIVPSSPPAPGLHNRHMMILGREMHAMPP